jgi:lectin-like protein
MPSPRVAPRATAALADRSRAIAWALVWGWSGACTPLRELSSYSDDPSSTAGAIGSAPAVGGVPSSAPAPADALAGAAAAADASAPAPGAAPDAGVADASARACDAPGEIAGNEGECYLLGTLAATWSASSAACADWGGTLVRIDSAEEEALLGQNTLADTWIGLNDLETEGEMRWEGGAELGTFSHWAPDQPDDFDGTEDCVELLADGRGYNDRPCADLRAYLCER